MLNHKQLRNKQRRHYIQYQNTTQSRTKNNYKILIELGGIGTGTSLR